MSEQLYDLQGISVFRPALRVIDQSNAQTYLEPLRELVQSGKDAVLDLSEIHFMNSAGLGSIVMLVRDAKLAGRQLRICSPQPTVRSLFKLVRLENIAEIDDSPEAAAERLR